jgi:uncharacterized lipoprotein YddW (UPF0748 family)
MKHLLFIAILLSSAVFAGEKGVRGVWLTNVDSEVLNSRENIKEAVDLCEELNLNSIFVVVWNKAYTLYPSKVMEEMRGEAIDPLFKGRDPLKELIEEAHSRNIKVTAWFEFGFSSSFKEDGGVLLKKKPEWRALDSKGELVTKNGFEWMNGFNPEVQDFLLSLITEVVVNYNIDGIQGDDRLPAMPSEAGYDKYTVDLFKAENGGNEPPEYHKDYNWIKWRSGKMNDFMIRIFNKVKEIKPEVVVSMAPSIYPWSEEEYLQDWPAWLRGGYAQFVCPQVYRYNINAYKKELSNIVKYQIAKRDLNKVYPGILLKVGSYYADESFLREMINVNREKGLTGEVYFFYEGLKKHKDFFKSIYDNKIEFPDFNDEVM